MGIITPVFRPLINISSRNWTPWLAPVVKKMLFGSAGNPSRSDNNEHAPDCYVPEINFATFLRMKGIPCECVYPPTLSPLALMIFFAL